MLTKVSGKNLIERAVALLVSDTLLNVIFFHKHEPVAIYFFLTQLM